MEDLGLHRRKVRISAGSIDDGMEICMQRYRMATYANPKIGGLCRTINHNISESPCIITRRGKNTAYALDGAQIGVGERVLAFHWRAARVVRIPWSK